MSDGICCHWCHEPLLEHERSPRVPQVQMHEACLLRSVTGSIAHHQQRCSCFVPGAEEGDDPALSPRQNAELVATWVRNQLLQRKYPCN